VYEDWGNGMGAHHGIIVWWEPPFNMLPQAERDDARVRLPRHRHRRCRWSGSNLQEIADLWGAVPVRGREEFRDGSKAIFPASQGLRRGRHRIHKKWLILLTAKGIDMNALLGIMMLLAACKRTRFPCECRCGSRLREKAIDPALDMLADVADVETTGDFVRSSV